MSDQGVVALPPFGDGDAAPRPALAGARIGVVGSGSMAEAVLRGLLSRRLLTPDQVRASHPRQERRSELERALGVEAVPGNVAAAQGADVLLLAVKPQALPGVMAELREVLTAEQLVLSVVAGASTHALGAGLDHGAIVRSMPNTPAAIGQGVTVWYATRSVTPQGKERTRVMLSALGREFEVHDERQVGMATAVSGSGPTYTFLFIEAMIDAAVHLGFPRHVARELVLDTVQGSAAYALASGRHVAELREAVTSPGGTSAEALYQLERGRLRTVVSDAVWAAFERVEEIESRLEGLTEGGALPGSGAVGRRTPRGSRRG